MAIGIATVKLGHPARTERQESEFLRLLLRFEAWLDARASRKALYGLDERALADIGLTQADLGRSDPAASWQRLLLPAAWR